MNQPYNAEDLGLFISHEFDNLRDEYSVDWTEIGRRVLKELAYVEMRTFYCRFAGAWPVGACAIALAHNEDQARQLIFAQLMQAGLADKNPIEELEIVELPNDAPIALIVLDGDY